MRKKDLEKILLRDDQSIMRCIEMLEQNSSQIVLVVSNEGLLLGSVTDGDVRRALLKGQSLDESVREIMNPDPVTAQLGESDREVLSKMERLTIHQIPVLDDDGKVQGLRFIEEFAGKSTTKTNWVVLMAGGLGTRLRPLTESCPKPLIEIGGRPLLETIVDTFREQGFRRFFMSVNYKAELFREHFGDGSKFDVEVTYLHEKEKLGTAGSLSLLTEQPTEPLIVMNADLLTTLNFDALLEFHKSHDNDVTVCVRKHEIQVPYGVVKINGDHIGGIDEKPVKRFFVNAGIYVLSPAILKWVPKDEPMDMTSLIESALKKRAVVRAFPIREYWLDIGQHHDVERAKGEYSRVFDS